MSDADRLVVLVSLSQKEDTSNIQNEIGANEVSRAEGLTDRGMRRETIRHADDVEASDPGDPCLSGANAVVPLMLTAEAETSSIQNEIGANELSLPERG